LGNTGYQRRDIKVQLMKEELECQVTQARVALWQPREGKSIYDKRNQ
jgi:hypothetical protein